MAAWASSTGPAGSLATAQFTWSIKCATTMTTRACSSAFPSSHGKNGCRCITATKSRSTIFRMIVDLDFVAVMHRHPFFPWLDGNADEQARVVIVVAHFIDHVNCAVAKLPAGPVEEAHAAMGANQAVLDGHITRTDVLPASQVFAVEKLLPVTGLAVEGKRKTENAEKCE